MNTIMNVRMAKTKWPHGYYMNDCRVVGVPYADIVDTDTFEIVYSGTLSNCKGKMEFMQDLTKKHEICYNTIIQQEEL